MQADIHPSYQEIQVTCSCGNQFKTHSTRNTSLHVDICDKCHPFYTGTQKMIDTAGRVDRFNKKFASYTKHIKSGQAEDKK